MTGGAANRCIRGRRRSAGSTESMYGSQGSLWGAGTRRRSAARNRPFGGLTLTDGMLVATAPTLRAAIWSRQVYRLIDQMCRHMKVTRRGPKTKELA